MLEWCLCFSSKQSSFQSFRMTFLTIKMWSLTQWIWGWKVMTSEWLFFSQRTDTQSGTLLAQSLHPAIKTLLYEERQITPSQKKYISSFSHTWDSCSIFSPQWLSPRLMHTHYPLSSRYPLSNLVYFKWRKKDHLVFLIFKWINYFLFLFFEKLETNWNHKVSQAIDAV